MGALVFTNGAWTLGMGINVARHSRMDGTTTADTGTIGLDGDAAATTTMPAGWVANGTAGAGVVVGTAGGDMTIIGAANAAARAALLQTRTRVSLAWLTNPQVGAGSSGEVAYEITKGAVSPWLITLTLRRTPNAAPVQAEVYVEYLWSAKAGR